MKSRQTLIAIVLALFALAYLPYIVGGGSFMIDDWQIRGTAFFQGSIWNTFRFWNVEGGSGMRPIASFFFAVTPKLFGESPVGYVLLNTALWLSAVLLFRCIVQAYTSERASWWFAVLAAVPTIASTTIFEPVTMIIGTSNMLLWALSLRCLQRYLETGEKIFYALTYVLIIVALLIYEAIAPLLLLTALLPFVHNIRQNGFSWQAIKANTLTYFAPIVGTIAFMSIFQKFIVPFYGVTLSRLSSRPLGDMARSFARWVFTVVADTPMMIFFSLQHNIASMLTSVEFWFLVAAVIAFVLVVRRLSDEKTAPQQQYFLAVIALSLVACSALSVFSGINMRVEGIENRFLGSTWLMLSVLLGMLFARLPNFGAVFGGLLVLCVYWSFSIQAFNYLDNRRIQNAVFEDCIKKLNAAEARGERVDSAFIVGNVPVYATKNFNNEVVFAYRFDFGGGLRMKTGGKIDVGQVVNINHDAPKNDTTRFFASVDGDTVLVGNLTGVMKRPINEKTWWYEYDQTAGKSELVHITRGASQLDSILAAARLGTVNIAPLPVTERVRNGIKAAFSRK
jgi:hypothetical protein